MSESHSINLDSSEIVDEKGKIYKIAKKIGKGGQGDVFLVDGGKYAIKILRLNSEIKKEKFQNQLAFVKRLPLEKLPIAKPISLLKKPHIGYVMEFASGMEPICNLISPPKDKSIAEWYIQTGGLKRRLILLKEIAKTLKNLHSQSLAFVDLSHNNIFVSSNVEHNEIFFIDTDNLRNGSRSTDSILYTPGYAAPEILNGKSGVNTLTDSYSFSVLAFQLLTLIHPLMGDYVNDGEPELEEKALLGKIPWVEDTDEINRSSNGIPREIVLSSNLKELFQKTFGQETIYNPRCRPSIAEWYEKIMYALDFIIECPECKGTYFFESKQKQCPFCEAKRPSVLYVQVLRLEYNESKDGIKLKKGYVDTSEKLIIQENIRKAITSKNTKCDLEDSDVCGFEFKGEHLIVYPNKGNSIFISKLNSVSNYQEIERPSKILIRNDKEKEDVLHFDSVEKSHRVFRFRRIP